MIFKTGQVPLNIFIAFNTIKWLMMITEKNIFIYVILKRLTNGLSGRYSNKNFGGGAHEYP
jgi:hypothetical protein